MAGKGEGIEARCCNLAIYVHGQIRSSDAYIHIKLKEKGKDACDPMHRFQQTCYLLSLGCFHECILFIISVEFEVPKS